MASSAPAAKAAPPRLAPQKYKVILIGDQQVGKTCLLTRYLDNTWSDAVEATIGVDFKTHTEKVGNVDVRLQLWDTAGQERFRSLTTTYLKKSAAAVIVYDVTNKTSFDTVQSWLKEVRNASEDPLIFVVGNKMDLQEKRQVTTDEGLQVAKLVKAEFAEVSAKTGDNVSVLFHKIAETLLAATPVEVVAPVNTGPPPMEVAASRDSKKNCAC
mmetsp:Transcript_66695/g.124579  ORF Transcript_66695/g.124579 Transcript_66695/m.124579 type:complete len:213 (-) Transcript_66695:288-926(-)